MRRKDSGIAGVFNSGKEPLAPTHTTVTMDQFIVSVPSPPPHQRTSKSGTKWEGLIVFTAPLLMWKWMASNFLLKDKTLNEKA
jgi:hypothetical protein